MLSLITALVLTQVPDWVEQARVKAKVEVISREAQAFCSPEWQQRMHGFEVLCAAKPKAVTTAHWRAPKKDESWTVRVDTLQFDKPEQVTALIAKFRELSGTNHGTRRADGGFGPTLSWCETSYVFAGDTAVVVSVACGAERPWCAVTEQLLNAAGAGTIAVVGRIGGTAQIVTEPSAVWRTPRSK
ncbi:MAG: hypothetical protein QM817_16365 [Archangium sp.]